MRFHIGRSKRWLIPLAIIVSAVLWSGCTQSNNLPAISKLQPEKDWVIPSGENIIVCAASDADGDSLTYAWSATGGTFSGEGSVVTWTAPDTPGTYDVTVTVTDGKGGEVSSQLSLDVLVNHAPVIGTLSAEPSVVNRGERAILRCFASDPDGDALSYQWTAARGNILGQGAIVTWIAPNTCDDYIIKVIVSDSRGSEASGELRVRVKNPG